MMIIEKIKAPFVKEKPKYGKVIALTAIGVAAVEAAAFLGLVIAKKIRDGKIEKQLHDEGFEPSDQASNLHVVFENESEDEEDEEDDDQAALAFQNFDENEAPIAPACANGDNDDDSLLFDAAELAIDSGKIATSMLQRRLSIGYGRAAKLIDRLEEMGVVGPSEGTKPRKILMTADELEALKKKALE